VSPDYRYRRIGEVLEQGAEDDSGRPLEADDAMTETCSPTCCAQLIVAALKADPATQATWRAILEPWDGVDRADQAAPLLYQALYRRDRARHLHARGSATTSRKGHALDLVLLAAALRRPRWRRPARPGSTIRRRAADARRSPT
jgi:hypothetical protein